MVLRSLTYWRTKRACTSACSCGGAPGGSRGSKASKVLRTHCDERMNLTRLFGESNIADYMSSNPHRCMNTTTTRTRTYAEERFALAQRRMGKFTASPICRSDERLFEDAVVPRDGGVHRRVIDHLLVLRSENILIFLLFLDVKRNGCGCVHEMTTDGGTEPKSAHQRKRIW